MCRLIAILFLVFTGQAEVIDRVAITVGRQVVSELELEEELRVTAFFNQDNYSGSSHQRQAAANRLVQQLLISREMRLSRYAGPSEADIQDAFDRLRAVYPTQRDFEEAFKHYGLNEEVLKKHLGRQIATLKFIEYRFRPELGVSEKRTDEALDTWLAEMHKQIPVTYLENDLRPPQIAGGP